MVLLDHLTRGRVMFGVGPGALPSDAFMMGIDVARQRDMMEEAFEAILELLAGEKPVNRTTDWFTLKDARLQLRPYSDPCFEIAVAAQVSPSGPRLAGRFGASLLSIGATNAGRLRRARRALGRHGGAGRRVRHHRRPPQVAPRRPDAHRRHQGAGLRGRAVRPARSGSTTSSASPPSRSAPTPTDVAEMADAMNASGFAVIGTLDDAIAQIQRLIDQSGGFGTFLIMAHDWADRATPRGTATSCSPATCSPSSRARPSTTDGQPRLGRREPARVHQRRHRGGDERRAVTPPGEGREGRPGRLRLDAQPEQFSAT